MRERDDFDVDGLRVLVTGSSRGIGEEIATYLGSLGAHVAVHGRDAARIDAVRSAIVEKGGTAISVSGDARFPAEAESFVTAAASGLGGLDALVNNAGGTFAAPAAALSPNGFAAIITENLTAPFTVARSALPHLEASRGSIVNIGSVSGLRASPNFSHYGAAKAGLASLTRSLAAEWGERGIRVNAVFPGLIGTPSSLESLFDGDPLRIADAEHKIGVGRLGAARDVAMACRYLLAPAAGFVHGEILVLDGGPTNIQPF